MTEEFLNSLLPEVLEAVLDQKKMSQRELASNMDRSPTAVSFLKRDLRKLSTDLAEKLAAVLGGDVATWKKAQTPNSKQGTPEDQQRVDRFVQKILSAGSVFSQTKVRGTMASRRLVNYEIIELFDPEYAAPQFAEYIKLDGRAEIWDFDKTRVQPSSYDTRFGCWSFSPIEKDNREMREFSNLSMLQRPDGMKTIAQDGKMSIAPGETVWVETNEHFVMPRYLEADVAPPTALATRLIDVGHGPILDPEYEGCPWCSLTNIGHEFVDILPEDAFLSVRFTLLDVLPLTDEEMKKRFDVARYNLGEDKKDK